MNDDIFILLFYLPAWVIKTHKQPRIFTRSVAHIWIDTNELIRVFISLKNHSAEINLFVLIHMYIRLYYA